jgi:hypothetical protein
MKKLNLKLRKGIRSYRRPGYCPVCGAGGDMNSNYGRCEICGSVLIPIER